MKSKLSEYQLYEKAVKRYKKLCNQRGIPFQCPYKKLSDMNFFASGQYFIRLVNNLGQLLVEFEIKGNRLYLQ